MVQELIFTVDNPCSTTIYESSEPSKTLYYVESLEEPNKKGKEKFYTIVRNEWRQELARLEWNESTPDEVHFPSGVMPSMSINTWMKPGLVPFSRSRSFRDVKGRKYEWKYVGGHSSSDMELHAADISSEPIVRFQRSYPFQESPAKLLIGDRASEILDLVVLSFIFLEKENRVRAQISKLRL